MKYGTQCLCFMLAVKIGMAQNFDSLVNHAVAQLTTPPNEIGLSIGLVHKGHGFFYNYGNSEIKKPSPPTQHTLYEIGSITKTFTSYLLAKAVLEKKLKLTDDIRKYLRGSYPNLSYERKPITILHLANWTSGLPDWLPEEPLLLKQANPDSSSFLRQKIYGSFTRKDFYRSLHKVKLDTIPGYRSQHSNSAGQLLAYILESIYKKSFGTLINEQITSPRAMNNTVFLAPGTHNNLARGYDGNARLMPYFTAKELLPAGGLYSTTDDMVKYIRFMLERKNDTAIFARTKTVSIDVYGIALNWFVYTYDDGYTQTWTDGGTSGFVSYLVMYPQLNSGIILLCNRADQHSFSSLPRIAYEVFQGLKAAEMDPLLIDKMQHLSLSIPDLR